MQAARQVGRDILTVLECKTIPHQHYVAGVGAHVMLKKPAKFCVVDDVVCR